MDEDATTLLVYSLAFPVLAVLLVVAIGAVMLAVWIVASLFRLIPKFFHAYKDGHALKTWPAMLFYVAAPTGVIVLGTWLARTTRLHTHMPTIELTSLAHSDNAWVAVLAVIAVLCFIAMHISAAGVYFMSFSWAHLAYAEKGFNAKTILLVGMLFVEALLVLPTMVMWLVAP